MLNDIYEETKGAMGKSLESLKRDYQSLRTGKVSIAIVDNIMVNYYGTPTPLAQVATVLATDATTITITPWEKNQIKEIEKAIQEANIGVNPNSDKDGIKLFFPPMTVEQRQKTAKDAKSKTEDAKVAIRNIRQNSNNKIKKLKSDKVITEDDDKKAHNMVQKITDEFIAKADEMFKTKEAEILKV